MSTATTRIAPGLYELTVGELTFKIERTMGEHAQYTSEGWHVFELTSWGEEYCQTYRTKADAIYELTE